MSNIIIYNPLLEINTYSGEKYYIELSKEEGFVKQLNELKFIRLSGNIGFASSNVRDWHPANLEVNMLESEINKLNYEDKLKIKKVILNWRGDDKNKELTIGILTNMIKKVKKTFDNE